MRLSIKRARVIRRTTARTTFKSPKLVGDNVRTISVIKNKPTELLMLADSGAEEYCVQDISTLTSEVIRYNDQNFPNVQLGGAGGEPLSVTASGNINDIITGAYVCDDLDVNILSTNKLREKGYWFIQPPACISPDNAGFFLDRDGRLALVCDQILITDVNMMNQYNCRIFLPDIQPLMSYTAIDTISTKSVNLIYGFSSDMTVDEKVNFIAKSFLLEQEDLCFLSLAMDNFPSYLYLK